MTYSDDKEPSPWVCLTGASNQKYFVKRDLILSVSGRPGQDACVKYIDHKTKQEITISVCETVKDIFWRL